MVANTRIPSPLQFSALGVWVVAPPCHRAYAATRNPTAPTICTLPCPVQDLSSSHTQVPGASHPAAPPSALALQSSSRPDDLPCTRARTSPSSQSSRVHTSRRKECFRGTASQPALQRMAHKAQLGLPQSRVLQIVKHTILRKTSLHRGIAPVTWDAPQPPSLWQIIRQPDKCLPDCELMLNNEIGARLDAGSLTSTEASTTTGTRANPNSATFHIGAAGRSSLTPLCAKHLCVTM